MILLIPIVYLQIRQAIKISLHLGVAQLEFSHFSSHFIFGSRFA